MSKKGVYADGYLSGYINAAAASLDKQNTVTCVTILLWILTGAKSHNSTSFQVTR